MKTQDEITSLEENFPYPELLKISFLDKYRYIYYEMPKRGFQRGVRNYLNLLKYLAEIHEYNEQHARSFVKRFKSEGRDWNNSEAIFSEIIVYRYYLRLVYEGLIKNIQKENDECDIIIELLDGRKHYLEVFCIMPHLKLPEKKGEIVVQEIKTHTQEEMASIRQKLIRKIEKQKQLTKPRINFAVIDLNDTLITGDFAILSSFSGGYKITIDKETLEATSSGYDWSGSIFNEKGTEFLKGIIYFDVGDYQSRKIIINEKFKEN